MLLHGLVLGPGTLDVIAGFLEALEDLPNGIRVVRIEKILDGEASGIVGQVFPEGPRRLSRLFWEVQLKVAAVLRKTVLGNGLSYFGELCPVASLPDPVLLSLSTKESFRILKRSGMFSLPPQFLLHPVEGLDVPDLELHGPFTGEPHGQDREPVPGDEIHGASFTLTIGIFNDLKIEAVEIFRDFKGFDVPKDIVVTFSKVVCDVEGCGHDPVVDDLDFRMEVRRKDGGIHGNLHWSIFSR